MSETFALYKLIIMYMLDKVDFPLTNGQISEFILDKEYTTYFTLQQAISEMVEAGFIREESTHNRTMYHLTEEGASTIEYFVTNISATIRHEIDDFLAEKAYELKSEVGVRADFYQVKGNEYHVRCQIIEGDSTLIDLTLSVPSKEEAVSVANNWTKHHQELYAQIMMKLL
jgi:DNA-binding PadR family transcriptional regulator